MADANTVNRRKIKSRVLTMLRHGNHQEIYQLYETSSEHLVLNSLFGALCSPNEPVRWSSVYCFGLIVPRLAERKIEQARVVMRRFLWSLNDESGGIGWGAPESLAEIMCHCRQLRIEYLHILISYMRQDGEEMLQDGNYLELPMLQRGLLWGVGRLCQCHRDEMIEQNIIDNVAAYLSSPDVNVAGLALWILGSLRAESIEEKIVPFVGKKDAVHIYRNNSMEEVAIGRLAQEALLLMHSGIPS